MINANALKDIECAKEELDKAHHHQKSSPTAQMLYFVCSILFWMFFALINQISEVSNEIHDLRGIVAR